MTISRTLRLMTSGVAVVVALAGCSGGSDEPSPSPSSPSVTMPSATPTPTPPPSPSPSTDAERAATDAVIAYIRVVDKLGIDPAADMDELSTVATGDALAQMQYILLRYRQDGWRQVGGKVPAFHAATPGSSASEWTISMCVDLSAVDLLDANGNSVKNPDGPPRVLIEYGATESLAAGQWYVATEKAIETC